MRENRRFLTSVTFLTLLTGACGDDRGTTGDEPVPACKPGAPGWPDCPVKPPAAPVKPDVKAPIEVKPEPDAKKAEAPASTSTSSPAP